MRFVVVGASFGTLAFRTSARSNQAAIREGKRLAPKHAECSIHSQEHDEQLKEGSLSVVKYPIQLFLDATAVEGSRFSSEFFSSRLDFARLGYLLCGGGLYQA